LFAWVGVRAWGNTIIQTFARPTNQGTGLELPKPNMTILHPGPETFPARPAQPAPNAQGNVWGLEVKAVGYGLHAEI
jgi:hypothetical protein